MRHELARQTLSSSCPCRWEQRGTQHSSLALAVTRVCADVGAVGLKNEPIAEEKKATTACLLAPRSFFLPRSTSHQIDCVPKTNTVGQLSF